MSHDNSKLVYSTEQAIPRRERPVKKSPEKSLPPLQQKVTVRLDRKGRGGKSVTVIEGLQMPQKKMESLLKQLKSKLGTGGTVKDTSLEIQGDRCGALMTALKKMGYRPEHSGR